MPAWLAMLRGGQRIVARDQVNLQPLPLELLDDLAGARLERVLHREQRAQRVLDRQAHDGRAL